MDWRSVAGLLAERIERPVALLDWEGRFLLLNAAMGATLGRRSDELTGRNFIEQCVASDRGPKASEWLEAAKKGERFRTHCELHTPDGRRLAVSTETNVVGPPRDPGLLVTLASVRPAEGADLASREFDYEVTAATGDFGRLRRVTGVGGLTEAMTVSRCFEFLYQRSAPCVDCPVLRSAHEPWPRTVVRRRRAPGGFELLTAHVDGERFRLTRRLLPNEAVSAIQQARIEVIADRGGLTDRERAVLRQLLEGRTLEDIATELGVSQRTVKFHQGNLLQKLGADSRIDLLRVLG